MQRFKRVIVRTCFILIGFIPFAAIAHYIVFPQETRSILVDYADFKKNGVIYFNPTTSLVKIEHLKSLIEQATARNAMFWVQIRSNPKFIYCDNLEDFNKYSINQSAPAVTYLKMGSVIVLSSDAVDLDIIAHEVSHAELYERIGFYKFNFVIPSWFKHGLAMQNDDRDYYSEDTLRVKSDHFKNLPNIKIFTSDVQFYAGSREQIMLNYMTAKHEIKNWYTRAKLDKFIRDLNDGLAFEVAYSNLD